MTHLNLRLDLEPWNCDKCEAKVHRGWTNDQRFYCNPCGAFLDEDRESENEESEEETSEVDLEENV